jgi:hypothetical protein
METLEVIKIAGGVGAILTAAKSIYELVNTLKSIRFKQTSKAELKLGDYNIDLFTQDKYKSFGYFAVGLPLLTIAVILLQSEPLNKSDIFLLCIMPTFIFSFFILRYVLSIIMYITSKTQEMFVHSYNALARTQGLPQIQIESENKNDK